MWLKIVSQRRVSRRFLDFRQHRLESLEDRQMMAADVDLIGGEIVIQGTEESNHRLQQL